MKRQLLIFTALAPTILALLNPDTLVQGVLDAQTEILIGKGESLLSPLKLLGPDSDASSRGPKFDKGDPMDNYGYPASVTGIDYVNGGPGTPNVPYLYLKFLGKNGIVGTLNKKKAEKISKQLAQQPQGNWIYFLPR